MTTAFTQKKHDSTTIKVIFYIAETELKNGTKQVIAIFSSFRVNAIHALPNSSAFWRQISLYVLFVYLSNNSLYYNTNKPI